MIGEWTVEPAHVAERIALRNVSGYALAWNTSFGGVPAADVVVVDYRSGSGGRNLMPLSSSAACFTSQAPRSGFFGCGLDSHHRDHRHRDTDEISTAPRHLSPSLPLIMKMPEIAR